MLQRQLMEDDCYLPGLLLTKSEFMDTVTITSEDGNTEYLTDGCERTTDGEEHLWKAPLGTEITAVLDEEKKVEAVTLIFDSDINRDTWGKELDAYRRYPMKCHVYLEQQPVVMPETLIKAYEIWILEEGSWQLLKKEKENYRRLVKIPVGRRIKAVKVVPQASWGAAEARIYRLDLAGTDKN